jgi:hypothetical protein
MEGEAKRIKEDKEGGREVGRVAGVGGGAGGGAGEEGEPRGGGMG